MESRVSRPCKLLTHSKDMDTVRKDTIRDTTTKVTDIVDRKGLNKITDPVTPDNRIIDLDTTAGKAE